jgi:Bacterial Ig domain
MMWRKASLATWMLLLTLCLGAPAAWAAAPFGFFSGLVDGGNSGNGVVPIAGWALADSGVFAVDIVVDGAIVGRSNYGRSRPLVTKEYPHFPDSAAPGFGYELDTTKFLNGMHFVSARVESRTGEVAYLNRIRLQFTNTEADLLPFGKIEFPNLGAQLYGTCTPWTPSNRDSRNYNIVQGYALGVNVQNEETGIGYVELLLDGANLFDDFSGDLGSYNSKAGCEYLPEAGGYTNCYGLYRPDLLQIYPGLKDTPNAGFRFALDIGDLMSAHVEQDGTVIQPQYVPGSHQIDIRVGDIAGNVTDIASIAVFFTCFDFTNQDLGFGMIDNPVPGLLFGGNVIASGWALDYEGVNAVLVYVDGNLYNFAYYGLARPDIFSEYPNYPTAATSGWYSYIDTTQLSNGVHELSAQVVDSNGVYTFIGKIPMTVENPIP